MTTKQQQAALVSAMAAWERTEKTPEYLALLKPPKTRNLKV